MIEVLDAAGLDLHTPGRRDYALRLPAVASSGAAVAAEAAVHILVGGSGPTLLVAAGVHGDEYEGQLVVRRVLQRLTPDDLTGRLILLPSVSRPAAIAGTRRSPLDGHDLGRLFPAGADDGPSSTIARAIADWLLPHADLVFDFHSGGRAMEFVPSTNLMATIGTPWYERCLPFVRAFGAPWAIVFEQVDAADSMPHQGTLEGAAIARGIPALSTELPGGGRIDADAVAMGERGLLRLMGQMGLLRPAFAIPPREPSRIVALRRPEHYLPPPLPGVLLPQTRLGDAVKSGDLLAIVYAAGGDAAPIQHIRAPCDGIVIARASGARPMPETSAFFLADAVTT